MAALTPKHLEHLKQDMQRRQQVLLAEIREVLARSGEQPTGELADVADVGDQSVTELLLDLDNAMVGRAVSEIRDIEAAQERIAGGSYGQCIDCGQPIPYERLLAFPSAKRCLPCQAHYEKTHDHPLAPTM